MEMSIIEQSKRLLFFLLVFTLIFLVQGIVHFLTNDALVTLLPGDGCGQILNFRLQKLIKAGLLVAYTAAALFAFSFAWTTTYGGGVILLIATALISISFFLIGGIANIYFHEHLTACDMFFMGSDAPMLNFGVAALLLGLTIAKLVRALSAREVAP